MALPDQQNARRDALLLKLLKTPPQPRPKRERDKPAKLKKKDQVPRSRFDRQDMVGD
jgi:hypothetical protein